MGFTFIIENNEAIILYYDGQEAELIVPATLGGIKVTQVRAPGFVSPSYYYGARGGSSITKISLPETLVTIDPDAFSRCNQLGYIEVSADNPNYCSVDGVLFDKEQQTILRYPIARSDVSATLPDAIIQIGSRAFANCFNLEVIILNKNIRNIGAGAFEGCTNLREINLPQRITAIEENTFRHCRSLQEISIPEGVTRIGVNAFSNSDLVKIQLPDTVTEIGKEAFMYCRNLSGISLSFAITEIGARAFAGCENLESIIVDSRNERYTSLDGVLYSKDLSKLLCYPQGRKAASVSLPEGLKVIPEAAFSLCTNLTEVALPASLQRIEERAFDYCRNLRAIVIPESVTEIADYAFNYCDKLSSAILPAGLTEIAAGLFRDCSVLREIRIPEGVKSIGAGAFSSCSSLEEIIVPDGVEYLAGSVFEYCASLSKVSLPPSLTRIGTYAFSGCSSLARIDIPDSVIRIEHGAFSGCTSLKEIVLPQYLTAIELSTFSRCSSLSEIIIPDFVVSVNNGAFYDCANLTTVTIPPSVAEIRHDAFEGCNPALTFCGVSPSVAEDYATAFGITFVVLETAEASGGYPKDTPSGGLPGNIPEDAVVMSIGSTLVTRGDNILPEPPLAPQIIGGRTMLPFRYLVQTVLGGEVEWDGDTKTITAQVDEHEVVMRLDLLAIRVDEEDYEYGIPPLVLHGHTLRALACF